MYLKPESDYALKLLCIVSEADKADVVLKLLKKWHVSMLHQFHAEGTASSEMLEIFGLGGTAKTVSLGVIPGIMTESLLNEADIAIKLRSRGGGIAFTSPLSGISSQGMHVISEDYSRFSSSLSGFSNKSSSVSIEQNVAEANETETQDRSTEKVKTHMGHKKAKHKDDKVKPTFSLIVASLEQGYSEDAVSAAHNAGATGGTVWAARKAENDFSGINGLKIQGEREVLMIVAPKAKKLDIMKAVNAACGTKTDARGIIISLPIDDVIGIAGEF